MGQSTVHCAVRWVGASLAETILMPGVLFEIYGGPCTPPARMMRRTGAGRSAGRGWGGARGGPHQWEQERRELLLGVGGGRARREGWRHRGGGGAAGGGGTRGRQCGGGAAAPVGPACERHPVGNRRRPEEMSLFSRVSTHSEAGGAGRAERPAGPGRSTRGREGLLMSPWLGLRGSSRDQSLAPG